MARGWKDNVIHFPLVLFFCMILIHLFKQVRIIQNVEKSKNMLFKMISIVPGAE